MNEVPYLKGKLLQSFSWNNFEVPRIGNLFDFIELNVAFLFLLSVNSIAFRNVTAI